MKVTVLQVTLMLAFLTAFAFNINAQGKMKDKIVLITGDVYVGEIIVKTVDIVLIKTESGLRFQFPISAVQTIENESVKNIEPLQRDSLIIHENPPEENLCAMVELSGGLSKGNLRYTWSSGGEISMAFGTKKILGETIFAGVGVAYQVVSVSSTSEMMGFIPVFVRLQSIIMKKEKTAPYLSLDAGYAFTTDPNYGGGTYAKFSTGFMHKISFKMSVYAGLYARAQGFSGALSETVNAVNVTYQGNSSIYDVGAKVGIQF